MLSVLRASRVDPAFVSSSGDLLQSAARTLILLETGVCIGWYVVATEVLPDKLIVSFFPIVAGLTALSIFVLWLLQRSFIGAQTVWQVGLAMAITLSVYLAREPDIVFLYAVLPLTATITLGWQAGLIAEGAIIALVWWVSRNPIAPTLPPALSMVVTGAGAFMGIMGWVSTSSLLTVTQWSLFSFHQAQQKVEEARDQRLEIKQIQQDLILANRGLARLSDRLRAMYQVAEEARQTKEEFVANVSHELRTPLNMIIGFSEMITESPQVYGVKLPPALLADIAAIQRNSQHLAKLVDDVLDLSQVEAGRMALSKEWVSVQAIIDEAVVATQALFRSKGLYLETKIPRDLPQVFCDGTRVRQVVLNLLSNAGRLTQRGGVHVQVRQDGNSVVVSVADTGPGISEEEQKRLFQPFQQLGNAEGRQGGSGLGLAISRQFVEMHGGKMWLESKVGLGTVFHFSLPLTTPPPVAGDDVSRWFSPYQEYEARTRRSKAPVPVLVPRFVILEQGDALQRLFGRYLDGVEVIAVRSGEDALRELGRSPARALIVNAPNGEIPLALRHLSRLPYDAPAISCWVPGPEEAAKRLGVVQYLVKPVARDTLLSALAKLPGGAKTVLLVDDEPEILQLFARMISAAPCGYRILQATNGQRALDLLRERRPDVMLLDLIMPEMDGFQILREKAADAAIQGIPVIVISSRDPAGELILGGALAVSHAGAPSAQQLLNCIQAISEALSPSVRPGHRGQPTATAG